MKRPPLLDQLLPQGLGRAGAHGFLDKHVLARRQAEQRVPHVIGGIAAWWLIERIVAFQ